MIKKAATALATGMLALSTMMLPAAPASAAGGGCHTSNQNGFSAAACSADNGVTVSGDAYINSVPSYSGTCTIKFWLEDLAGYQVGSASSEQPCYVGHHAGVAAPLLKCHTYQLYARIKLNGVNKWSTTSPYTYRDC